MKIVYTFFLLFLASYSLAQEPSSGTPPINRLANRLDRKGGAEKALQEIEKAHREQIPLYSDSLFLIALKYYERQEKSDALSKTYLYLGYYYQQRNLTENALSAFIKAENALPAGSSTGLSGEISTRIQELKTGRDSSRMEDMSWKYRYEANQQDVIQLKKQVRNWRTTALSLGIILTVLLLLFRYRWLERKRELFESQLFIEKLQRAEDELREKLSVRLSEKDNKLKDFFRQRVTQIKDFIELSIKYGNNYEKLKSKFSGMVSTDSFTEADWRLLREGVNIMGHGIMDCLEKNYPGLTEDNLRYCSLICAGFETDELAILWAINNDSIYKRRTRLRQKLNLEKTQDLKNFFDKLIQELQLEENERMS